MRKLMDTDRCHKPGSLSVSFMSRHPTWRTEGATDMAAIARTNVYSATVTMLCMGWWRSYTL